MLEKEIRENKLPHEHKSIPSLMCCHFVFRNKTQAEAFFEGTLVVTQSMFISCLEKYIKTKQT